MYFLLKKWKEIWARICERFFMNSGSLLSLEVFLGAIGVIDKEECLGYNILNVLTGNS